MSDIDKDFLRQKIKLAGEYFEEMNGFLKQTDENIISDSKNRYALERVFLLLVEEMIDINNHLIKTLNLSPIDNLKSSFIVLGENKILPKDFAEKIAPLAGVRNILVHQYEKIDSMFFLTNLRKNIGDFPEYFELILNFLNRK